MEGFQLGHSSHVWGKLAFRHGESVHFHPWILGTETDTFAYVDGQQDSPARIEGRFITA
jgi:hypothetical protein